MESPSIRFHGARIKRSRTLKTCSHNTYKSHSWRRSFHPRDTDCKSSFLIDRGIFEKGVIPLRRTFLLLSTISNRQLSSGARLFAFSNGLDPRHRHRTATPAPCAIFLSSRAAMFDPLHRWAGAGGHNDLLLILDKNIGSAAAPCAACWCPYVCAHSMRLLPGRLSIYLNSYPSAK